VTEGGTKKLIHVLVKLTQFCVSFVALWSLNRCFQTRKAVSFQIGLCPILTFGRESWVMTEKILSQVQVAEDFAKSQHCDTLRQSAQM